MRSAKSIHVSACWQLASFLPETLTKSPIYSKCKELIPFRLIETANVFFAVACMICEIIPSFLYPNNEIYIEKIYIANVRYLHMSAPMLANRWMGYFKLLQTGRSAKLIHYMHKVKLCCTDAKVARMYTSFLVRSVALLFEEILM